MAIVHREANRPTKMRVQNFPPGARPDAGREAPRTGRSAPFDVDMRTSSRMTFVPIAILYSSAAGTYSLLSNLAGSRSTDRRFDLPISHSNYSFVDFDWQAVSPDLDLAECVSIHF